jgi:uncharacterized protein involved in exopolysaccharide biosynthesis
MSLGHVEKGEAMVTSLATSSVGTAKEATMRGFVESMFRHRRRFFTALGFVLLLTVLYVFFSPKKYESDMSLIVENARKPQILSAEPTTGQAFVNQVTEEQVYSQVEILGSGDVLDEVADPGWRSVPLTLHSTSAQLEHEGKVNRLRKHLNIAPVRKSNVIDVSYRANDPRDATATLQRVMTVFLAREKVVSEPAGASQFFQAEAKRSHENWAMAQQQLAKFQQAHHIVSIGDSETNLQKAIEDALVLQRAADAEISEVSQRLRAESGEQATTPIRQKTSERIVPASGSVDQVNTLLAQLMLRRAQLTTEYLPSDPIVQQVDSQIAQAKAELANSKALQSVEVSTNVNPSWQVQDQAVFEDKAHLQAAKARRREIADQVNGLEKELKSTESATLVFASLQQKVAQLDANYQLYMQKRDAAQISEAMNEQGLINIGVAQSPTFSLSAVRPRPLIDSILGVITAILMGCFAVYLSEAARQTISSPAELEASSGYPMLATVGLRAAGYKRGPVAPRPFSPVANIPRRRSSAGRS